MNYDYILAATLNVYQECDIHSFPLKCFEILHHYGLSTHPYSTLSDELREYCMSFSNDALYYKDKICYNDKQPRGRNNFSLMHELGHVLLKHSDNHTSRMEQDANIFASNILAPRIAIHYAACKNHNDVSNLFDITKEAAGYAFDSYKRWYRKALHAKMSSFDQTMYHHFYNEDAEKFVYNIKECLYCSNILYNTNELLCAGCNNTKHADLESNQLDMDLLIAENQWLYNKI